MCYKLHLFWFIDACEWLEPFRREAVCVSMSMSAEAAATAATTKAKRKKSEIWAKEIALVLVKNPNNGKFENKWKAFWRCNLFCAGQFGWWGKERRDSSTGCTCARRRRRAVFALCLLRACVCVCVYVWVRTRVYTFVLVSVQLYTPRQQRGWINIWKMHKLFTECLIYLTIF